MNNIHNIVKNISRIAAKKQREIRFDPRLGGGRNQR